MLKIQEHEYLAELGQHKIKKITPNEWISEGFIDHTTPDNPPADRFIRKWLLKKDIEGRECELYATIFFNDSLSYRLSEFEDIISQFPNIPILLK